MPSLGSSKVNPSCDRDGKNNMKIYLPTENNIHLNNIEEPKDFFEPKMYCDIFPLLLGAGAGAAAIGSIGKSLFGSSGATGYQVTRPDLDKGDYTYHGTNEADWQGQGAAMQERQAAQANYRQADAARNLAVKARDQQNEAVRLQRQAALGNTPSVAQLQQQQGIDAAQRSQASMAASARGGGLARAAAQRQAMANAGDLQTQAVGQSAQLRAQEMAQARAAYGQQTSALRSQDQGQQQLEAGMAQYQSDQQMKQRALNDQMTQGTWQLGQNASMADQKGTIEYNRQNSENWATEGSINAKINMENSKLEANKNNAVWEGITGAGKNLMSAGMSDEREKEDVKPADKQVKLFLDSLKAHEYKYKNPLAKGAAPGEHVSVMAQELEKSKLGKKMVEKDSESGNKMVDYGSGLPVMLAALASINKRQNELEKALKSRKGSKK